MSDEIVVLPKDKQPTLRVVPMPADSNATGDIFGGWVMSQVDIAGSIAGAAAALRADRKTCRHSSSRQLRQRQSDANLHDTV